MNFLEKLDALMPPAARLTFKVGLDDGEVTCHATVAYGPWSASVYEPQRPGQPPRDLVAEYRAQEAVRSTFRPATWAPPTTRTSTKTTTGCFTPCLPTACPSWPGWARCC